MNELKTPNPADPSNRDPISKAPGAHPVGVGVWAAVGGVAAGMATAAATGAAVGTAAGPVGTLVGRRLESRSRRVSHAVGPCEVSQPRGMGSDPRLSSVPSQWGGTLGTRVALKTREAQPRSLGLRRI